MTTITLNTKTIAAIVATATIFTSKDGEFAGQLVFSGEDAKLEVKAMDGIQKIIYRNIEFVSSDLTDTSFTAFSVDGKKLTTVLKAAKSEQVQLELHTDKIVVKSGRSKVIINVFANTQEVSISRGSKTIDFLSSISGLEQVLHTVDSNNVKPELTGIALEFNNGICNIVGTDAKRLGVATSTTNIEDSSFIIPKKAVETISKLFKGYEIKAEIVDDIAMTFHSEYISYSTQLINAQFPAWQRIVPKSFLHTITIQRSLLADLIKEASIFNQEIIVSFDNNKIKVCDFDANTEVVEEFESNAEFRFGVQAGSITDFLDSHNEENIEICFNGDSLPILLKANNSFFEIVMPIAIIDNSTEEVQNVA